MQIKKYLLLFAICVWLLGLGASHAQSPQLVTGSAFVLTGCIQRLLNITAYYTPQAIQWVYFNGDYHTEKKINWGNPNGASGKPTYNGMLAAPKKYPFSTTVHIPWIGIGAVYDRWWAIIATADMDRIDIRAWYGLQGMVNALYWWSKTMTGEICSWWIITAPQWFDWSKNPSRNDASKRLIWTLNMERGNSWLTVGYLQSFLSQLWYLSPTTTPFLFDTGTKQALCLFQQQQLGLSGDNIYCGFYGTKTRSTFLELFKKWRITIAIPANQVRKTMKRMLRVR